MLYILYIYIYIFKKKHRQKVLHKWSRACLHTAEEGGGGGGGLFKAKRGEWD